MTSGIGSGFTWGMWTCDPRISFCEVCHLRYCEHVTPGARSGGVRTGACGRVTAGVRSGRGGHSGDCGRMTPDTGSGRVITLVTVDM